MAHIKNKYSELWKPQDLNIDKIDPQKMFIDNIDMTESKFTSIFKSIRTSVKTISALKSIDTSDNNLFVDGMMILVEDTGIFRFNRNSTDTVTTDTIIQPNVGGGRWISILLNSSSFHIGSSEPSIIRNGMWWYNPNTDDLRFRSSNTWILGGGAKVINSSSEPTLNLKDGLLWYNPVANEVKIYISGVGFKSLESATAIQTMNTLSGHISNKNNPHEVKASQILMTNGNNVDSAIGQKADKTQISNPNLLINGDFQVWQRGTSFTSGFVPGIYTADRWRVFGNADSSIKVEKVADGMKITALTNGAVALITQKFETYLKTFLSGKKVTFSAEIDGVTVKNTYTYGSGDAFDISYQVLSGATAGTSTIIKNVKLELGDIATPFSPRSYAEELAMCQRYYEVLERVSVGRFNLLCAAVSTTEARAVWSFKVSKRTYGNLQLSGSFREVPSGQSVTLALYEQDNNTLTLKVTGLTFAVGHSCVIQPNDAGGSLILDAEIY